jgi:quercetin dioxygenase-like cupin family protein
METSILGAHGSHLADEVILLGGVQIRFLLTGLESNGRVAIFEATIPAESALPSFAHRHEFEEICYGLSGSLAWTVNDAIMELMPGQTLCIPGGAAHAFANQGKTEAKVLFTLLPGVVGPAFFREMSEAVSCHATMTQIMRRHGIFPALTAQSTAKYKHIFPSSPPSWHGFA